MGEHDGGNLQNEVTREEHQHNLRAKRVIQVNSLGQVVNGQGLTAGVDYDYLDVQQTDSDTETHVYKLGGSGGITVRTIVINYTDSGKTDVNNMTWS